MSRLSFFLSLLVFGFAIRPALAQEVPAYAQPQPTGALSGKRVVISPGHGFYYNTTLGWTTQRGDCYGLIEDRHTNELAFDYLLRMLYNSGATAISCRERGRNTEEIVLDNSSAEYSDAGTWHTTSNSGYGYGDGLYRYAYTSTTETATATWRPTLPSSGYYPVYVWYYASSNRVTDATYRIQHSGGTTCAQMNQEINSSRWLWLGEYHFEAGTSGSVTLINQSQESGVVIADAVRFGGGMGTISRGGSTSGKPKWKEAARYWTQYVGAPESIWNRRSTDNGSDVVCRPRFADWMGGDAYFSIHTNAGGGTGTSSFIHNTSPTPGSALLQDKIHDQVVADIRALWNSSWTDRGHRTANFGELRELDTMPATLIEIAFHDLEQPDNAALHEDEFRQLVARAMYKGIARYFDTNAVIFPLTPTHLRAQNLGGGTVRLSWRRHLDPIEPSAVPTAYKVYLSANGYGFDNGTLVTSSSTDVSLDRANLPIGAVRYVRVSALNAGGESFPTETLAFRVSATRAPMLIVTGYDRLDRYVTFRRGENTFNYTIHHASAIAAITSRTISFDSATNEAVRDRLVSLNAYDLLDWILGQESTADEALDSTEQQVVSAYLDAGGALLVSGAEIAWDLDHRGSSSDSTFIRSYLRASYVSDDSGNYRADGVASTAYDSLSGVRYDDGSLGIYAVPYPDVIAPANGSVTNLLYSASSSTAGVQYDGSYKLSYLGFPIETVHAADRVMLMEKSLDFLLPGVPSLPKALAGLGSGSSGWLERITTGGAHDGWLRFRWQAYNNAAGATHPAAGDVDGDGLDELAVGMDSYPANGGWVAVMDDAQAGGAIMSWVRVRWSAYDRSNGATWPALGDLDGDGRAELVIGLGRYPTNGGWLALADDATQGFASLGWYRVPWQQYAVSNGETRPALGDLDGDGRDELFVGFGTDGGGWLHLAEYVSGHFARLGWRRVPWAGYNSNDGQTWPATGDLDGDGLDELACGLGSAGSGWLVILDDVASNSPTVHWRRLNWNAYSLAAGETRPACGDWDGDSRDEILVGLGPYPTNGGWLQKLDDLGSSLQTLGWLRVHWSRYNATNGETHPTLGR